MADVPVSAEHTYDVDGRDPERTPIPWDATTGAGFTTGKPWLPIGAEAGRVIVAAERDDPASMLSLYRRLIWYRKASSALRLGRYRSLATAPEGVFAFLRTAGEEQLLVALNFRSRPVALEAGEVAASGRLELSTDPHRGAGEVDLRRLAIGPDEGVVVRLVAE